MAYIGKSIESGTFSVLDTSGNTYNGSNTAFNLGTQVGSVAQLLVSHDGVIQKPGTDYTLSSGGAAITFTTAPASGASIFIVEISGAVGGPLDSDLNGTELILDADGDTSITADTDDQIDFKIAGADDLKMTANAINVLSGTTLTIDSGATITNSGTANGFGTDPDGAQVFNESGADVDFRVETNSNANMLFISGGNDVVGVGAEGDLGVGLHIKTADTSGSVSGDADELVIEGTGHNGMTILSGASHEGRINFGDSGASNRGFFSYDHSADAAFIGTGGNNIRVKVASDGDVLIAKTSLALGTAGHEIQATGLASHTRDSNTALQINREGSDGFVLGVHNDASFEGGITFSGGTVSYSAFCGSHWTRLADNSKPTILRGTVVESIATMCDWYEAVAEVAKSTDSKGNVTPAHKVKEMITLPDGKSEGDAVTFTSNGKEFTGTYVKETNQQLPMCKISDTEDSKAVYGVFMSWDDQDDGLNGDVNDMNIASLGAYVVRIHKDETVAIGDYLQSKGDGTAKKQADDILRASTIAKVTSTEKTHEYADGSYCVPCTLHCG